MAEDVLARDVHARYIGQLHNLAPFALWHFGRNLDRTLCGRKWKSGPKSPGEIRAGDVYDRDWCCSRCLRSAASVPVWTAR